jgi:quercetin dioxygenase-like cupin family protein
VSQTRRELIESLAGFALVSGSLQPPSSASEGRQGASARKTVFESDLPNVAINGWAVTAIEVNYGPGQSTAPHRHPGLTLAYVLEGEVRSKVGDGPERTYKVGEMWLETPGQLHAVSGNASTTAPAKILAVLLAEKGKPLTTPEK